MSLQLINQNLIQQIKSIAKQQQRPPEAVIAEAIQRYLKHIQQALTPPKKPESFLLAISGISHSGQKDVATRSKEILAEEIRPDSGWTVKEDNLESFSG